MYFRKDTARLLAKSIEALNIRVTTWATRVGGNGQNYANAGTLYVQKEHTHTHRERNCKKKNWACNQSFDTNASLIFLPLMNSKFYIRLLCPMQITIPHITLVCWRSNNWQKLGITSSLCNFVQASSYFLFLRSRYASKTFHLYCSVRVRER